MTVGLVTPSSINAIILMMLINNVFVNIPDGCTVCQMFPHHRNVKLRISVHQKYKGFCNYNRFWNRDRHYIIVTTITRTDFGIETILYNSDYNHNDRFWNRDRYYIIVITVKTTVVA